jgi:hypothetical protein
MSGTGKSKNRIYLFCNPCANVKLIFSYNRGAIPGSLCIPYTNAFTADGNLVFSEEATILNENHGALIAVVGNRGDSATKVCTHFFLVFQQTKFILLYKQFAEKLLRLEYPKICVLHRGIDIFRSGNILIVP